MDGVAGHVWTIDNQGLYKYVPENDHIHIRHIQTPHSWVYFLIVISGVTFFGELKEVAAASPLER